MKGIILPGNSALNKSWAIGLKEALKSEFDDLVILNYKHWDEGGEIIDFKKELINLTKLVSKFEDYFILAKSVGVFLTVAGVHEKLLLPKWCVLMGTPLNWAKNIDFDCEKYFRNFSTKALFIQQKDDPITKFNDLKKFLEKKQLVNYKLAEVEGNDHSYDNFNELKSLIINFGGEL